MNYDFGLENKTALVTGGSQGIGQKICELLAESGANLVINHYPDDPNEQAASALAEDLAQKGVRTLVYGADVSNKDQVTAMMDKIKDAFEGLDILVNNAGVLKDRTLQKMSDEEWYSVIDVNLNGAFLCCREALPLLRSGGSIIGISSLTGVCGNFGQANYAASKAGLIGFYKSLAKELGPKGIRVNAIAPGLVQTAMADLIPQEAQDEIKAKTPLRRLATPKDIARAVRFLASNDASYITGHVLHVDGGLTF